MILVTGLVHGGKVLAAILLLDTFEVEPGQLFYRFCLNEQNFLVLFCKCSFNAIRPFLQILVLLVLNEIVSLACCDRGGEQRVNR